MSRPATTMPAARPASRRWMATIASRTAGRRDTSDTFASTSGRARNWVASRPFTETEDGSSPSGGAVLTSMRTLFAARPTVSSSCALAPCSRMSQVRARYMMPVSRKR